MRLSPMTSAVALSVLLVATCFQVPAEAQQRLFSFSDSDQRIESLSRQSDDGVERAPVQVDLSLLETSPTSISVPLPNGTAVTLHRVSVEARPDATVWRGRVEGAQFRGVSATLTQSHGYVSGRIYTAGHSYWLKAAPGGGQELETDHPNEAACGGAISHRDGEEGLRAVQAVGSPGGADVRVDSQMNTASIDILAMYTTEFASRSGGDGAARNAIGGAGDYLTTAFQNSGVSARARIVGIEKAPSLNVTGGGALLPDFRTNEEIRNLRAQYGADTVHLFVGQPAGSLGYCGVAYLLTRGDSAAAMSPYAYGITTNGRGCSSVDEVFAHEIGHNLGANHDPANAGVTSSEAVYPYAFGHSLNSQQFDSIMVYGSYETVPYFTSVDVVLEGGTLAIAGERENARALKETVKVGQAYSNSLSGGGGGGGGGGATGPTAPSQLSAVATSGSTIVLTWTDNSEDETTFQVQMKPQGGSYSEIASLPANTTTYTAMGLSPGQQYVFRVRGFAGTDNGSFSSTAAATTTDTSAPTPLDFTAVPVSANSIRIAWSGVPAGKTVKVQMTSPTSEYVQAGSADGAAGQVMITGLSSESPYTFRGYSEDSTGISAYTGEASASTTGFSGSCRGGADYLCLLGDRFEVSAVWKKTVAPFETGKAQSVPVAGSDKTGLFWFFKSTNIELILKMLDGRSQNGAFWHFYGALSDVEYWITVRDTVENASQTYHNPPTEICGDADTGAFEEDLAALTTDQGPVSSRSRSTSMKTGMQAFPLAVGDSVRVESSGDATPVCLPAADTLCLRDGRFEAKLNFVDPRDSSAGTGQTLPALQTNDTGFFWFFNSANIELAVKVLDGTPLNGKFWVFWGALSDVEYTLTVKDMQTGATASYTNPQSNICGGADTGAL